MSKKRVEWYQNGELVFSHVRPTISRNGFLTFKEQGPFSRRHRMIINDFNQVMANFSTEKQEFDPESGVPLKRIKSHWRKVGRYVFKNSSQNVIFIGSDDEECSLDPSFYGDNKLGDEC